MGQGIFRVTLLLAFGVIGTNWAVAGAMAGLTKANAERRVNQFVSLWSSDRGSDMSLKAVSRNYADPAVYYGKQMSHRAVLQDKKRYARFWPERHYRMVPGSVSLSCAQRSSANCHISGILRYDRRSKIGIRSVGAARLRLIITRTGGNRIVRESAMFLR